MSTCEDHGTPLDADGCCDTCAAEDAAFAADCEPTAGAFCDRYEQHEPHTYTAINRNTYRCSGITAEDLDAIEAEANRPPCEHGLSAALCAGPGHYPADR